MNLASKSILKQIASIQVEALLSLQKENPIDKTLAKYLLQVSSSDVAIYDIQLRHLIEIYQQISEVPSLIYLLDEYQLLVCSHILYRMEEDWIQNNPLGVQAAWEEINICMQKFHPEYSIINETINKKRK